MRKTLLATAIAATTLSSVAQADIIVTNMIFGSTYGATGTLLSDGGGSFGSIPGSKFDNTWAVQQQTVIMDNTGSWIGTSLQGAYNYNTEISGMTVDQVAVGLFFNWNDINEIAILEIFDCNDDGSGDVCTGNGIAQQNGPFTGTAAVFNGVEVSSVPVPASIWLLISGLLGFVPTIRRRVSP